jgi:hypothetical protein
MRSSEERILQGQVPFHGLRRAANTRIFPCSRSSEVIKLQVEELERDWTEPQPQAVEWVANSLQGMELSWIQAEVETTKRDRTGGSVAGAILALAIRKQL